MRISDWSSDVCSSDLRRRERPGARLLVLRSPVGGEVAIEVEALQRGSDLDHHAVVIADGPFGKRSEEHTSELQSLMRNSYAVFCLKKTKTTHRYSNYN